MNPEERACGRKVGPDCKYLTSALSYWCTNRAACRYNGTSIPGFVNCPYYQPVRKLISPAWESFFLACLMAFCVVLTIILFWSLP